MIPDLKLRHMGMFVRDIETMAAFYTDVLGFLITDRGDVRGEKVVFLSRDAQSHHQLVMESGRHPGDGPGYGLQQISFWVPQLDGLRVMHQRVRARNDTGLIQCVDHGNSWSLYFRDPEANRIEVYTDTPWHIAQPYLEPLDLDLSDAEITRRTEQHMVGNPSKQDRADWVAAFAEQIRANHAGRNQA